MSDEVNSTGTHEDDVLEHTDISFDEAMRMNGVDPTPTAYLLNFNGMLSPGDTREDAMSTKNSLALVKSKKAVIEVYKDYADGLHHLAISQEGTDILVIIPYGMAIELKKILENIKNTTI